jgi:hypothetical protein
MDISDVEGWLQALLTDLAGLRDCASELLQAAWDVQSGQVHEWSIHYNVYGVEIRPTGARITFNEDSCQIPLELMERDLRNYLWP